jgi:hypothetical protein
MSGPRSISSWFRRRAAPAAATAETDAAGAQTPAVAPLVVQIFDAAGSRTVEVDARGERLTDLLNREASIQIRGAASSDAQEAAEASDPAPQVLDVDDVLILIPPAQSTDPRRHLHRPQQPIQLRIGPYDVTGGAHVPPGVQATGFLLRQNPRFVALTNAIVRGGPEQFVELRAAVAIVNLRRAELLREVTPAG